MFTMSGRTVAVPPLAPGRWLAFTTVFVLLSLGPFIVIGGLMTHVPGPWALVRYLPIVGAARMPTRLSILVLLALPCCSRWPCRPCAATSGGREPSPSPSGCCWWRNWLLDSGRCTRPRFHGLPDHREGPAAGARPQPARSVCATA
jgi:hypothetical protein